MKFYILSWEPAKGGPGLLSVHFTESSARKDLQGYGTHAWRMENGGFTIDLIEFIDEKPRDIIASMLAGRVPLRQRVWPKWQPASMIPEKRP